MTEYATNGLFGLLTPQANTTAEPEFHALSPPGMVALTARMTSTAPSMDARLRDYVERLAATIDQFANAPLGAIALACTGMSYIVPQEEERRALGAIEDARGAPVLTAAAAILTALETLDARRVAILSPYGDPLHGQGMAYWAAQGLEIVRSARLTGDAGKFHPIYGMGSDAVAGGLTELGSDGLDAVLVLGTGLPTLPTILARKAVPVPVLSPNLCLMWHVADRLSGRDPSRDGLMSWLTGAEWRARFAMRHTPRGQA